MNAENNLRRSSNHHLANSETKLDKILAHLKEKPLASYRRDGISVKVLRKTLFHRDELL